MTSRSWTALSPATLAANRPLLIAYYPVRDPLIPEDRLTAYERAGVDVIEMGLKAQNPKMDGAIVSASMRRATGSGHVSDAVPTARRLRALKRPIPGVLICYPEPQVLRADAEWSEFDAVLCLETDHAAQKQVTSLVRQRQSRTVEMLPYEFGDAEIDRARTASSYVMLQYTSGKTGLRQDRDPRLKSRLCALRGAGIAVPIIAGVGISDTDQVRDAMDQGADGIVVGSKALQMAEMGISALEDYLWEMRETLDNG